MNIDDLVRENIRRLKPFSSARSEFTGQADVWLNANESPYENGVNRYPDPYQRSLKSKISELKQVSDSQIFIGNGSDEIIDLLLRTFCRPGIDKMIFCSPSFTMYEVAAVVNDISQIDVPLDDDFDLDVEQLLSPKYSGVKLIFVCSPNNPTGNLMSRNRIEELLSKFNGIVVVDEAYIDFASEMTMTDLLDVHPNLVILQTMSKAYGAAGLRIGIGFASEKIITYLNMVKMPYNVGKMVQEKALEILEDVDSRKAQIAELISERKRVEEGLKKCKEVEHIYKSNTNFVLVRFKNHIDVMNRLLDDGIVVRDRSSQRGCENCLRLTIGTSIENDKLLKVLL